MKQFYLILALLGCGSLAHAIDPSEVIITLDGAYARPLGPQHFAQSYNGYGLIGMVEKALSSKYSIGVSYSQYTLLDAAGDRWGMSSFDLMGRRWFKPWKAFNPYVSLGLGGNLFRDSYKKPYGDVFHGQLGLGSQYVFDKNWAMEYGLTYHMMAPLDVPYHFIDARVGLSFRYGTQPKVNRIAPPPVQANGVEELSEEKVQSVVGGGNYRVQPGDNLYNISGQPRFLGDPNLWPLVADNNQLTVDAAQLIIPGQVIKVRRTYTEAQKKAAIRKASKIEYKRPTAQK